MFVHLNDARANVKMLLNVKEIMVVKEYLPTGEINYPEANAVVMTRPIDTEDGRTHNYFVKETVDEVHDKLIQALDYMF